MLRIVPVLCLTLMLWSCGGGAPPGPERYHVSGKVTYDGKPVPFGSILFDPDASAKNSGPQGTAEIRDGFYDTSKAGGKGTVGGPMIISIMGTTHATLTEGGEGKVIFSGYTEKKDLPKEKTTLDFDIPLIDESAKKKKK